MWMEKRNRTTRSALLKRAAAHSRSGEHHLALQCYAELIARAPGDADAIRRYCELLERVGSPEEIEEFYARAHGPSEEDDGP